MVKLNNKGFGFHIVLPILALLAVGSIGAYMTFRSSAAVPKEGWVTMESTAFTGVKNFTGIKMTKNEQTALSNVSFWAKSGIKYRACAEMKGSISGLPIRIDLRPDGKGIKPSRLVRTTGSYKTYCTYGSSLTAGKHYFIGLTRNSTPGTVTINKIFWQRYY